MKTAMILNQAGTKVHIVLSKVECVLLFEKDPSEVVMESGRRVMVSKDEAERILKALNIQ